VELLKRLELGTRVCPLVRKVAARRVIQERRRAKRTVFSAHVSALESPDVSAHASCAEASGYEACRYTRRVGTRGVSAHEACRHTRRVGTRGGLAHEVPRRSFRGHERRVKASRRSRRGEVGAGAKNCMCATPPAPTPAGPNFTVSVCLDFY
jgi:hypothetical protein